MDENTQLLDWMDALCERASADVRSGDPGLLNSLSQHRALAAYYNNVHKLRSVPREAFPYWYPGFFTEAKMVKAQYDAQEQVVAHSERIDALEDKLDKLAGMIEAMLESKTGAASKKTEKRKKALTEDATDAAKEPDTEKQDEEEANPPAETDAEEDESKEAE